MRIWHSMSMQVEWLSNKMNCLYHVIHIVLHIVFLHKSKIHVLYSTFLFLFCKTPNSSCLISCKHNLTSSFSQLKQEIVWVTLLEISFLISYLKTFWTEVQMVLHKKTITSSICVPFHWFGIVLFVWWHQIRPRSF